MKLNKYGIKKNIGIGKNIGVRKNNIGIGKNNIGIGKYINLNLFLNILYGILFIGFIYFIYYYIFNKLHFGWNVELISDPNTLEPTLKLTIQHINKSGNIKYKIISLNENDDIIGDEPTTYEDFDSPDLFIEHKDDDTEIEYNISDNEIIKPGNKYKLFIIFTSSDNVNYGITSSDKIVINNNCKNNNISCPDGYIIKEINENVSCVDFMCDLTIDGTDFDTCCCKENEPGCSDELLTVGFKIFPDNEHYDLRVTNILKERYNNEDHYHTNWLTLYAYSGSDLDKYPLDSENNDTDWLPVAVPSTYIVDSPSGNNTIDYNGSIISFEYPSNEDNSYKQLKIKSNHVIDFKNMYSDTFNEEFEHTLDYPLFIYKPQINDFSAIPNDTDDWAYLHFMPNVSTQKITAKPEDDEKILECCGSRYFNDGRAIINPTHENPLYCGEECDENGNYAGSNLGQLLFPEDCNTTTECKILLTELPSSLQNIKESFVVDNQNIETFNVGGSNNIGLIIESDKQIIIKRDDQEAKIINSCIDSKANINCSSIIYQDEYPLQLTNNKLTSYYHKHNKEIDCCIIPEHNCPNGSVPTQKTLENTITGENRHQTPKCECIDSNQSSKSISFVPKDKKFIGNCVPNKNCEIKELSDKNTSCLLNNESCNVDVKPGTEYKVFEFIHSTGEGKCTPENREKITEFGVCLSDRETVDVDCIDKDKESCNNTCKWFPNHKLETNSCNYFCCDNDEYNNESKCNMKHNCKYMENKCYYKNELSCIINLDLDNTINRGNNCNNGDILEHGNECQLTCEDNFTESGDQPRCYNKVLQNKNSFTCTENQIPTCNNHDCGDNLVLKDNPGQYQCEGDCDDQTCCECEKIFLGPDMGFVNIMLYNDADGSCELSMTELGAVCSGEMFETCLNFLQSSDCHEPNKYRTKNGICKPCLSDSVQPPSGDLESIPCSDNPNSCWENRCNLSR